MLLRRTLAPLLILSLAACGGPPEALKPVRPAFDGKAVIAASMAGIDAGVYSFELTTPLTTVDGILRAPRVEIIAKREMADVEVTSHAVLTGDDRYLKVSVADADREQLRDFLGSGRGDSLPADQRDLYDLLTGDDWVALPRRPGAADLTAPDAVGVKALLGQVESASGGRIGGTYRIQGKLDASRLSRSPDLLGAVAKATVPDIALTEPITYVATTSDGQLSQLELTMPGAAGNWLVEITDYGTARPAPAPPAAQVRKTRPRLLPTVTAGGPVQA